MPFPVKKTRLLQDGVWGVKKILEQSYIGKQGNLVSSSNAVEEEGLPHYF